MSAALALSPETERYRLDQETAEIFQALARPIPKEWVKSLDVKDKAGNVVRRQPYITARTLMNVLDEVVGPENWWDEYIPSENSVVCRLSIRLPGGRVLTKCDAGAYAKCPDEGDGEKGGFSDAFKRAGVKFGVARELYGDGIASFKWPNLIRLAPETAPETAPQALEDTNRGSVVEAPEADTRPIWDFLKAQVEELNALWREQFGTDEPVCRWQDALKRLVDLTADHAMHPFDPTDKRKAAQWIEVVEHCAAKGPEVDEWLRGQVVEFLTDKWNESTRRRAGLGPETSGGS